MFSKNYFLFSLLFIFLVFQLIYGFSSPSVGDNLNWLPITSYLPKFSLEGRDSLILEKVSGFVSPEYRLNSDVGRYLEMARNFNADYIGGEKGRPYLNRPLYSLLIALIASILKPLAGVSYGTIFASAILLNFILAAAAVFLFFKLLQRLFSKRIAFLSSVLLIFSPFFHAFLDQPMPHILSALAVVASLYLLRKYSEKLTFSRLAIFSFLIGVLMLGKMIYGVTIFILIMALFSKRYREGALFLGIHLIPFLLWYFFVTGIWHIPYYLEEAQRWNMGIWIMNIFSWPWQKTFLIFLNSLPNFFSSVIYSFLLIPVVFSAIGLPKVPLKNRYLLYFGLIFSIFILSFGMNLYFHRISFLLFPVIYPTAVLGIERMAGFLKRYNRLLPPLFYSISIACIIFVSNLNIYRVFYYLN